MSSSRGPELIFYALVGGPTLLAWGLASLKERRLLQDTPLSKVRSAAMGLVAFQGIAKPRREIVEPLKKTLCCWWRCCVQEYRSSGKSGSWVTIKDVFSQDFLYIQDDTGKVLVNPNGAEFYVSSETYSLNSSTRPIIEPALQSWGINDTSWFGMTKQMRLIETIIFPDFPLYVLGMLDNCLEHMMDREQRLAQRLAAVKQNPQKMAAVLGPDGAVDVVAWETLVQKEQDAFAQEEAAREAQVPESDKLVVRKPDDQPFVLSGESEQELARSFGYKSFFMIFGGIAVSGLGTWMALAFGYSVEWTTAFVAGGFVIGMVIARVLKTRIGRVSWNSSSWSS